MRDFIQSIKVILFGCGVLFFCPACLNKVQLVEQQQIQLSNPIIKSDSTFFTHDLQVKLDLDLDGAQIHYTLDNSEPTPASSLYSNELILTKSANVKARAMHSDYLSSELVSTQFIKTSSSRAIRKITLNRAAHKDYQGAGVLGLTDYIKGSKDYKSKSWLCFSGGDLEMEVELIENQTISQCILSLFSHQSAWIFLPENVKIYTASQEQDYKLAATKDIVATMENSESEFRFVTLEFSKREAKFVKVILKNIKTIPDWHPGKGTPPWLFIDEILLN